ncbi:MAG TPA: hypothetical protein VEA38_22925 [Terriglobales bacterium]|nr:hypothetical protein [Terriglobales bacterium]
MKRARPPFLIAVLALLAVAGLVLQGGSVPHAHDAHDGAGIYNQEHDLTLMAGLAGHAIPVDAAPAPVVDLVVAAVVAAASPTSLLRLPRSGDSRAPPSA